MPIYKHPLTILDPQQKPQFPARVDWNNSITKELVGCWLFNEGAGLTLHDLSGNFNNGTGTSTISWSASPFGNAILFNGTDTRIDTTLVPSITAFTIITRVRVTTIAASKRIMTIRKEVGNNSGNLMMDSATGRFEFYGAGFDIYPAGAEIDTGKFFWIACTYQAGVSAILYIDGRFIGTDTSVSSITVNPLKIGCDYGNTNYFTGLIDTVYLFNRQLTASEVLSLTKYPYQFIIPANWFPDYFVPGAAPAAGLAIPLIGGGLVNDGILTQGSILRC